MKFNRLVVPVLLAVALLIPFSPASAKKNKQKEAPPEVVQTLIMSTDASTSSVVVQYTVNKSTHTYKIDLGTTIIVDGKPGTFGSLHQGMFVVSSVERDTTTLDSITVSSDSAAPAKDE